MPVLEKFDPTRPLVARKFFRLRGQIYRKGNDVPYSEADHRVVARLYDLRRISHKRADEETEEADATTPEQRLQRGNQDRREQDQRTAEDILHPVDDEEVKRLVKANSHDDLFKMASGLSGVTKNMKKAEIATELVRAGRGTA